MAKTGAGCAEQNGDHTVNNSHTAALAQAESNRRFPAGFLWGTASSSHQNEGNNHNNQWARFEVQPGAIWKGWRSGLACDWWRNAEADFDRMQALGIQSHRLSIEWSRVEPEPGRFDHVAIDRYRALVGGLTERGIRPLVCFHHFTDPLWLAQAGGWERPEVVARFQRYVHTMTGALADLCDFWLTINEPLVYLGQSWFRGVWPPHRRNPLVARRVFLHFLLAHAAAYHAIHAVQPHANVGYAKATRGEAGARLGHLPDRLAAGLRRHLFEHIWFTAIHDGRIRPPVGPGHYNHELDGSCDFIGVNFYSHRRVRFIPNPLQLFGREEFAGQAEQSDAGRDGAPYSELSPATLQRICRDVAQLGKPIYITENGLPDADDDQRPRWLLAHMAAIHRAIQEGCDIRGYYHWTFVDNFEWDQGWGLRFGLVELDPESQARRPRPSARMFAEVARQNAITPELVEHYAPDLLPMLFAGGPGDKR